MSNEKIKLKEYADPDEINFGDLTLFYRDEYAFPFLNNTKLYNEKFIYGNEEGITHNDLLSQMTFDDYFNYLTSDEKAIISQIRETDIVEGRIWILPENICNISNVNAIISTWDVVGENNKSIFLDVCKHYNVNPNNTYYMCEYIEYWVGENQEKLNINDKPLSDETKKELSDIFKNSLFNDLFQINSNDFADLGQRKILHMLPPEEKRQTTQIQGFLSDRNKKDNEKLSMYDLDGNFKGVMPKAKYNFYKRYGLGDSKIINGQLVEKQFHPEAEDGDEYGLSGAESTFGFSHVTEKKNKKIYIPENKLSLLKESLTDVIYHFTPLGNLSDIILSNSLLSSRFVSRKKPSYRSFSFTRQKNSTIGYPAINNGLNIDTTAFDIAFARIMFDGKKLSYNYHGEPHNDFDTKTSPYTEKSKYRIDKPNDCVESEDRIIKKGGKIPNIERYIIKIDILIRMSNALYGLNNLNKIKYAIEEKNVNYPITVFFDEKDFNGLQKNGMSIDDAIEYITNVRKNKPIQENIEFEYYHPSWREVLADIDRYYEDEIKPTSGHGGLYENILKEGLSDVLYHFTTLDHLFGIISDNTLKGDYLNRISFTRNFNSTIGYPAASNPHNVFQEDFNKCVVRLTIDGRKLGQRYKGRPFSHFGQMRVHNRSSIKSLNSIDRPNYQVESEDMVDATQQGGEISDILSYIIKIDILFRHIPSNWVKEYYYELDDLKDLGVNANVFFSEKEFNIKGKVGYSIEEAMLMLYDYSSDDLTENIEYEVTPAEVDTTSFEVQNRLAPEIWKNGQLNPKIRLKLLDIADDFFNSLEVSWVKPIDIILTGSICNFNWSKYSDIDLHIVLDFREVDEHTDFVKTFFDSKKNEWNNQHDNLEIFGYPVEVYVQDISEDAISNGVYSLEKDEWIKEANQDDIKNISDTDDVKIKMFASSIMTLIDDFESEFNSTEDKHKLELLNNKISHLTKKLKTIRQSSLDSNGEMSIGNLTYKVLRRTNYLDKLWDMSDNIYDKINSL